MDPADYDAGILDTNVMTGGQFGVPWYVDTRLLFYRRDLLAQAGYDAPPRDWDEWVAHAPAHQASAWARDRYAMLLPLNEYEPMVALWLQQGEPLLRDGGRFGNFRSHGFARTLRFYLAMYERHLAPPIAHDRDRQRLERVRPRLLQLLRLRAVADGRVQEAAASRAPVGLDDGAPPWPHGPRRVHRRRVEPGDLPALAAQGRGLEAGGVPLAPGRAAAILPAHRRPAGAAVRLGRRRAWRRIRMRGPSATSWTRAPGAEGAGVGADRHRAAGW